MAAPNLALEVALDMSTRTLGTPLDAGLNYLMGIHVAITHPEWAAAVAADMASLEKFSPGLPESLRTAADTTVRNHPIELGGHNA